MDAGNNNLGGRSALPAPVVLDGSERSVAMAAEVLRGGGLVSFPTETVYGLVADAGNARAVAALYAAKGRPSFNPLIAHVADIKAAAAIGVFDEHAHRLAAAFWPGPLTLVLPVRDPCPVVDLARAGLDTIALRVPAHPVAEDLLRAFGCAVVAPSANRSGRVSPTDAAHVVDDLGASVDLVLDAGRTAVGLESTIVACLPNALPRLLRHGGVSRAEIEVVLGCRLASGSAQVAGNAPTAPGMLASHYAPRAQVRLNAHEAYDGEAWLGFGPDGPCAPASMLARRNLSLSGDLVEAAANLFADLRALDAAGPQSIAVAPIPETGLGEAINDRLRRAAAPREQAI